MTRLSLPGRLPMRKRLLPCEDVEEIPVTSESIQAAKEAAWRERYQVQMEHGDLISPEGTLLPPTKGRDS